MLTVKFYKNLKKKCATSVKRILLLYIPLYTYHFIFFINHDWNGILHCLMIRISDVVLLSFVLLLNFCFEFFILLNKNFLDNLRHPTHKYDHSKAYANIYFAIQKFNKSLRMILSVTILAICSAIVSQVLVAFEHFHEIVELLFL